MKRSKQFRKVIISLWRRNEEVTNTIIEIATKAAKREWAAKGQVFNQKFDFNKNCWVEAGA